MANLIAQDQAERLALFAQSLLSQDINGVLHRIRWNDETIIACFVGHRKIAFQYHGDGEFFEMAGGTVTYDFEHAHARFAILLGDQFHFVDLRYAIYAPFAIYDLRFTRPSDFTFHRLKGRKP